MDKNVVWKMNIHVHVGFISLFRKRNSHTRQGPEDTYFSSSGREQKSTSFLYFTLLHLFILIIGFKQNSLSFSRRAIEASEDLRGSTHIRRPQHSRAEVCYWNPTQPHNQTESHWSWWVTTLLRQSAEGLNSEMLIDFSNPQVRCLYWASSTSQAADWQ